jgi:rfaE bifunctional protein nucleotidyltransferase chain/domain
VKVVLANGCFDLLHVGHVEHLREARAMGDKLIVSLTLDQYIHKGPERPIYKWLERAELLRELKCVDEVIPAAGAVDAIRAIRPGIFVKGTDYSLGDRWSEPVVRACKEVGAQLRFTKCRKLSATDAIIRVMRAYAA